MADDQAAKVTSSEVTKVTSDKPKNPKRVEQGKRLAQISKEAKKEKMRKRVLEESAQNTNNKNLYVGDGAVVAGGVATYFL